MRKVEFEAKVAAASMELVMDELEEDEVDYEAVAFLLTEVISHAGRAKTYAEKGAE